jgi:hypothetical protein
MQQPFARMTAQSLTGERDSGEGMSAKLLASFLCKGQARVARIPVSAEAIHLQVIARLAAC